MAIKVCSVDIAGDIRDVELEHEEDGIFCLVRLHGKPIGDITILSPASIVCADVLRERIALELGHSAFFTHLRSSLLAQDSGGYPHRIRDEQGNLPLVSVIVCTRNRPGDLRRCLQSLSGLKYPRIEVLVVDNASDGDETRRVAEEWNIRCVREEKRGLDFARNRGISESSGRFVAFADDDVVVEPDWIDEVVRGFHDESIACVTGLTMPAELAAPAQIIFEQYGSGGFRKGYQPMIFDRLNLPPAAAGRVGAGANMAFRREIFDVLGAFDEALDCGTPAQAGGDLDMAYRILAAGYRICYQPTALVWHRHRSTMAELERQLRGYGTAVYAFLIKCLIEYRDLGALSVGASWFKHLIREAIKGTVGRSAIPLRLTFCELASTFRGPAGYLAGKAYASAVRHQEGSERRAPRRAESHLLRAVLRIGGGSRHWESL